MLRHHVPFSYHGWWQAAWTAAPDGPVEEFARLAGASTPPLLLMVAVRVPVPATVPPWMFIVCVELMAPPLRGTP